MDRSTFLNKIWVSYPSWPFREESHWVVGRVQIISESSVHLLWKKVIKKLCIDEDLGGVSPHFGPSIPWDCIAIGDFLAFDSKEGPYLLAPNLNGETGVMRTHDNHWALFLRQIHSFFENQGFQWERSPTLVNCPGVDHHIDPLEVKGTHSGRHWYLPTSPEIHLKKCLGWGEERVYDIRPCFRDDLPGKWHLTEFIMLEWYEVLGSLQSAMRFIEKMVGSLQANVFDGADCTPRGFSQRTVRNLFQEYLEFDLTPETTKENLQKLSKKEGIDFHKDDDWNDLFFRLFMDKIEIHLGQQGFEYILDWPRHQASLAKLEKGWAQRFELYWKGVELANAYVEVNDPKKNREIFAHEGHLRRNKGRSFIHEDEDFFEALNHGMPPSVGVALGVNRLWALLRGSDGVRLPGDHRAP